MRAGIVFLAGHFGRLCADAAVDRAAGRSAVHAHHRRAADRSDLTQVQTLAAAANFAGVATLAVQQPQFYNVTLRNIFAAESNRDNSVFVPLNDYIVTAIGMVHDDVPYNTALSADILYTLKGVTPAASARTTTTTRLLIPR